MGSASRGGLAIVGSIVALFLLSVLLVPIGTDIPLVDEPIYASSAFHFAETGEIVLEDLSAPTGVFEAVWGGTFVRLFGEDYGSLRLSTLVVSAVSAFSMFYLCRGLGASQTYAALGVAAYLFNPLMYSLSMTFQTDAHFVAFIVIASAFLVYGMRDSGNLWLLLAGSLVASIAFLSRQQAIAIPLAAVLAWLVTGPRGRRRVVGVLCVLLPTILVMAGNSIWVSQVGEPLIRSASVEAARSLPVRDVAERAFRDIVPFLSFMALFVAGLAPAVWLQTRDWRWVKDRAWATGTLIGLVVIVIAITVDVFDLFAMETWVTQTGFGGVDRSHLGERDDLLPQLLQGLIAAGLFLGLFSLLVQIVRNVRSAIPRAAGTYVGVGSVLLLGAAFVGSLAFHGRILDRYWLPLLPFVVSVAAALARPGRWRVVTSGVVIGLLGIVAVVGMRDAFVVNQAVTDFADEVVASGIDPNELDAGVGWLANRNGVADLDVSPFSSYDARTPWWVLFYAPRLQPTHAIATEPLKGYQIADRYEYASLLTPGADYLYLLTRDTPPFYMATVDA